MIAMAIIVRLMIIMINRFGQSNEVVGAICVFTFYHVPVGLRMARWALSLVRQKR